MSGISEATDCANGMPDTEEVLPPLLVRAAQAKNDAEAKEIIGEWHGFGPWGSLEVAQEAVMLAEKLGHWVNYDGEPCSPKSLGPASK
jgi:hypothetical protein